MMKLFNIGFLLLPLIAVAFSNHEKTWTGKYLGGSVGGIFNQLSIESNHLAFSSWDGLCNQTKIFNSAFIGPQIGFQKQFDSKAILGVEGDYTYNFSQSAYTQCGCDFNNNVYDKFEMQNRYQLSLKGRFGYALKYGLQPFFAAGVSFANLGLSYINEINDNYSHNQIRPGYVVGGGIDWAYNQHWNIRFEYFYNQYNALELNILNIYSISDAGGFGQMKLTSNNIRFAINYWIDG